MGLDSKVLSMKLIGHGEDKMKRFFFCVFFLSCNLYGIDWLKELKENFILEGSCIMGEMEYGNRFRRDGEELFVEYGIYNKEPMNQDGVIVPATDKFPLNVMRLNEETSFLEIQIEDSQSPFQIMILGDYHVLGIPKENFFLEKQEVCGFFQRFMVTKLRRITSFPPQV